MHSLISKIHIFAFLAGFFIFLICLTACATDGPPPKSPETQKVQGAENSESAPAQSPEQVTCTGKIILEKNWLGLTKGFVLRQDDGQQFVVSREGDVKQLESLVGVRVEATGTLEETDGERKIIQVIEIQESEEFIP